MNIETLEIQLQRVRRILDSHGLDHVVAGGYARDKFYGRTPKDVDVWVFPHPRRENAALEIERLDPNAKVLFMYGKEPNDPNTESIDYVLKVGDIDVIFLNRHANTALQLVNRFDCNVNRFVWIGDAPFYMTEEGTLSHVGPSEYIQQHQTTPARMTKMRDKWEEIQREQNRTVDS